MEKIQEHREWSPLRLIYLITFSSFALLNLHESLTDRHGYFIFIALIYSTAIATLSLLLLWITKLLIERRNSMDTKQGQTTYWITYCLSLAILLIPTVYYLIVISW